MLIDEKVFNYLFELALTSKDKEGVVAACLVRNDKIIASSPSSDDSLYHAEYLVIQKTMLNANKHKLNVLRRSVGALPMNVLALKTSTLAYG